MSITSLDTAGVVDMLAAVCETVIASEDELGRADREIGDGDHGQTMARGFSAAREYLRTVPQESTPHTVLSGVGRALIASMGGASGVVFGTLFRGSLQVTFEGDLTTRTLADHLDAAVEEIQRRGRANAGEKTMLDALIPATVALRAEAVDTPIADALSRAAAIAREGAESTRNMVARHGKSATLGPRSLGFPDPGAISVALIFSEMADWLSRRTLSTSTQ
jgi:dihydroxyacetone kinase-like protein